MADNELAAQKALVIKIMPDEIIGSEIMRNKEYKYASVGVKLGENEYLRITYEWKGDNVPEFVMGIMSWMTSNKEEIEQAKEKGAEEAAGFMERTNRKEKK